MKMDRMNVCIISLAAMLTCTGCISRGHAPYEEHSAGISPVSGPVIQASNFPTIFHVARGLALQLEQNMRDGSLAEYPCVVTTLADIDDLSKSSRFGRVMAEALGAEIFKQGAAVRDVRTTDSIMLEPGQGEFGLSREAEETEGDVSAEAVVAGTYGIGQHSVAVSIRLIDIKTNGILSVAIAEVARTQAVDSLLEAGREPLPTVYDHI